MLTENLPVNFAESPDMLEDFVCKRFMNKKYSKESVRKYKIFYRKYSIESVVYSKHSEESTN